jgi:hypothetical protein
MDINKINTTQTKKVAQAVSLAETFQSVSYAAVKARVNRLEQGWSGFSPSTLNYPDTK